MELGIPLTHVRDGDIFVSLKRETLPLVSITRARSMKWTNGFGTRKPLRAWFLAMWFITNQKNGMSALGLQRALGLGSYETAWKWLHKLRRAMVRPDRDRLTGEIEVDETCVGAPTRASTAARSRKSPS